LAYNDYLNYNFQATSETRIRGFNHPKASADALKFPFDLNNIPRNVTNSITAGAFEN
jgi:hypothetical protein